MSDKKISQLPAATTPLDGTEVLPIVQSGATVKVANNDLRPKQIQSNATSGVLQVAGPAAGATRVMTVPDVNFTAARTDAGQTFNGNQLIYGTLEARRSTGDFTGVNLTYGGTDNPIVSFNMNDGSGRYRFNMNSDVDIKFETNVGGGWGAAWQVTRVSRDVTVNTGNLVIGTAGKGIDFSADGQAAGMTSELLDDYEEGTWTGGISDGTNNATMDRNTGFYVKIGRQVTVSGWFRSTSLGSVTGAIRLTGLPFSINVANGAACSGTVANASGFAITAGQNVVLSGVGGNNYVLLQLWDATTGVTGMDATEWSADGSAFISITYQV